MTRRNFLKALYYGCETAFDSMSSGIDDYLIREEASWWAGSLLEVQHEVQTSLVL